MTKLLDEAIEKVRALSPDQQDRAAEMLLAFAEEDAGQVPLTDEQVAGIGEALAQAERGEFERDEEVARILRRS